ncbi:MAG: hypothetical protein IK097_03095 [Clostridia bacterium]|nr:hypothetical protein [Clostridia bacterium]
MKILGLDIGTTGIGAVLFETETRRVIKTANRPNNSFISSALPFEKAQDTNLILDIVNDIISEFADYEAIGTSGQMHGILYTDSQGNAVSPLWTWQDLRSAELLEGEKTAAEILGTYPGYGLATHLYNEKNGLVPENAKYLCTIGDYIAMKLCGNTTPVMHITNAASLGCFDIKNNAFTFESPLLPRVTSEFEIIGKTAQNIPVAVCVGDNQASFIGSVPEKGGVLINIGTGSQISYLIENPDDAPEGAELRPFDGRYYLAAGCALCGGRAFSDFEKFCREIANAAGAEIDSFYPFLDKILENAPDTDLIGDCRYCGTRANPSLTGGFSNLTEGKFTLKDFAASVAIGIIAELRDMYSGRENPVIIASGNGVRKNPAMAKYIEKIFGTAPLTAPYNEEAAAGAAITAAIAAGEYGIVFER